jgi:hypothetical protein
MSRRSRRREKARGREPRARPEGAAQGRPEGAAGRGPERPAGGPLSSLGVQLVLLAGVFVLAVLVAELFGAANLGVAFGVGQIAFAIAVVYLILRR